MENSYKFFANRECKYFPCHELEGDFNCLFCYCPLYNRKHCPGKYAMIEHDGRQIKSCMGCSFPHEPENYEVLMQFLKKPE